MISVESVQSWEFFFVASAALPFLFLMGGLGSRRKFFSAILFVLPLILLLGEYAFFRQGDLEFAICLWLLHIGVSLVALLAFRSQFSDEISRGKFFLWLLLSLATGLLFLPFSSAMRWGDPFWGVVPGPVSLDPIITLDFAVVRGVCVLFCAAVTLGQKRPVLFIASFWLLQILGGFLLPTSPQLGRAPRVLFAQTLARPPFEIFAEDRDVDLSLWAKSLENHLSAVTSELPPSLSLSPSAHFRIYLYRSDDAKAFWMGARQTQIGHFIRGEMHLSGVAPDSRTLRHELSHLIHGQLTGVPLRTYLDPFIFEGLAVAFEKPFDQSLDQAAALIQTAPADRLKDWPHGMNFFSAYSAPVSYALAGLASVWLLQAHKLPGDSSLPPLKTVVADLNERPVNAELLTWGRRVWEAKPLFHDPLRRDCARLEWLYRQDSTEKRLRKWASLCPQKI